MFDRSEEGKGAVTRLRIALPPMRQSLSNVHTFHAAARCTRPTVL